MEEKELKYKFLDLLYKHTYVLPANSIKKLILKFDKAQTLIKKQKLYSMLLEFEKLGVATIKDLRDIKKSMNKQIPEPVYEKEIKIKKMEERKKKVEKEEENIYDGGMKLDYINSALKRLKKFKSEGKYDTKIKIYYNLGYNNINDEELKKINKKIGSSRGQYEETFYLTKDDNINEVIEILNILKKNIKILNMFSYNIEKHIKKSNIIGLAEPIYEKEIEKKEEENILDDVNLKYINGALRHLNRFRAEKNFSTRLYFEYILENTDINDVEFKKLNKKLISVEGDKYYQWVGLSSYRIIDVIIEELNILKKNVKKIKMFNYNIGNQYQEKYLFGEGIKKNKKNNNSYLSLLKSMI
jgi:hypothetical protein